MPINSSTSPPLPLGDYLREALERKHLSANALAKQIGVSEGTIRNALKQGIDPTASDINPRILRAIAQKLDLNEIDVFQKAGYLSPRPSKLSDKARLFASRYDKLAQPLQEILWDILRSIEERIVKPESEKSDSDQN